MSILIRPAAAADIEDAFHWYEGQQANLGGEFLDELNAVLTNLESHPQQYPVIHRETRRALVARFPYGIFYRIYGNEIVVVACLHARRNPKKWQGRAE